MLERLRAAAGPGGVIETARHDDYRVAGVVPRAVVAPPTVEAAAAVLALCSEEGWPAEPAGGASWLAAGRPPAEPPVVLSTTRLRAIREYEPADLVVGAEAGLPLAELQAVLAANQQLVPLDPPAAAASSLGAIASLGTAGPLRALHGTPRDMVLGVEIVTGDGRLLHFGGRVVKNVAGYDLTRLLVGSRGTLGLITALFVRLRGSPDQDATLLAHAGQPADAAELAAAVRRAMEPDALELLDPAAAAVVTGERSAEWRLAVRLRGSEAAVTEAIERLRRVSPDARPLPAAAAAELWSRLAAAEARAALFVRVSGLPAGLPRTLATADRLIRDIGQSDNGLQPWCRAAHAASGEVRIWADGDLDGRALERLAGRLPDLAAEAVTDGGTLSWPVLPAPWADRIPAPALGSDTELRLSRELKARFDPAGILSPARHLSGF